MELSMGLGQALSKEKMAELYQKKFEAYKNLSALASLATALLGLSLWVWDWAVDPTGAPDTLYLRIALMVGIAPLAVCIFVKRLRFLLVPIFFITVIGSEIIFVIILNHLHGGHAYGSGAFIYWFLFIPIMGAIFSLRVNIVALVLIPLPPLIMYYLGYAPNLPVNLHIVYSSASFLTVAFMVFLTNRLILRLLILQDHLTKSRDKAIALAHTDPLTGVNNRRAFFLNAEKALAHSRRYKQPTSVIMIDIDHFKKVNDTHGHAAGDEVIKTIVELCKRTFREVDIIGRMGGEEFAVVLIGANSEDAMDITERLRQKIEGLKVQIEGKVINVTASFGITEFYDNKQSIDILLAESDIAMYKAKSAGRNCVKAFKSEE